MSEPTDKAAHIQRIKDAVQKLHDAATELEQAKAVEAKARAVREAKSATHRKAMDNYHNSLYQGWRARVGPQELQDAGEISKSRLYAVIKKLES